MPRPRVKDEDRKRVARACDTCKRRKEKCDGQQPCLLCKRRDREATCHFSDGRRRRRPAVPSNQNQHEQQHPRQESRDRSVSESSPTSSSFQLDTTLASPANDAEIAIESLLTLSGTRRAQKTAATESSPGDGLSHAPVPKLARLLRDGHGKFIFVGDSSTLAFLQNIRRLAKTAVGECDLTTDPKRHAMIEAIPTTADNTNLMATDFVMKPSRSEAQQLIQSYLLACSGVIDLFDEKDIVHHLLTWTEDTRPSNSSTNSIFYLVLAIGAQNQPGDNEEQAAVYFQRGRDLAVSSFMDDPSVLTVQSYVLIAFYMLTTCRRNGAFMLLGIAIRAAYALGLHRSDISILFEIRERTTRERVWKSLRVLDMFMSASLGRPPATSEVDGGNVSWEGTSRGYEDIRLQASHSSAMLRICFIFERVLNEVYCRREVSVQLVESISRQYRDWNLSLETGAQLDGLPGPSSDLPSNLKQMVGLAHIKGAYYWSVILLTRPFLVFDVSSKLKAANGSDRHSKSHDTATLSEACIDAALRSIEIGSDLVHEPGCPRRPIMITNSVFVSALVIGLAIFGDYDKTFPLLSSLDQAKVVLGALSKFDPAGRRYVLIAGYLQEAALEHIRKRDAQQLKRRRQGIHSIFGDIFNPPATQLSDSNAGAKEQSAPQGSANSCAGVQDVSAGTSDFTWSQRLEEDPTKRGPILTTSGLLAIATRDSQPSESEDSGNVQETSAHPGLTSPPADIPSIPSYAEEFPLFSLTHEFDPIGDAFLDFV